MYLSNVPTLGYISWKDLIITYNGQSYQIQNSYTCKPYIYWDYNDPYQLTTSNSILKEMSGRFYLLYNDKGVYTQVPQELISISFAENTSRDLITEKILGFKENFEQNGERFTTIETTIEGVKQTVGQVQEDVSGNTQKISQLEQSAEQISLDVTSLERKFNEDLDAKELRDNISSAILALQSTLGLFSSDMNTYMEDNRLSDAEAEEIATYKDDLETKKLELNVYLDTIIAALTSNGQIDKATTLTTQKDLLNTAIGNLITNINTACTDKIFTNTEMATIVSYFANVNSKLSQTKNLVDNYIFLGIGGDLIEEIGKIVIKQNQISLGVSRTESSLKNSLNLTKALIQDVIDSNNTTLVKFKNCLSVIIEDRDITQTELDSLQVRIDAMDEILPTITNKKDEIIGNPLLSENEKNDLIEKYNNLISKYNAMKQMVNNSISDGVVNDAEIININKAITDYYDSLNNVHSSMCNAVDNIDANTTNKAITDAKNEVKNEVNDLSNKVDGLEADISESISSGLIDQQEKENILQNLSILEREKIDIDNRYNEWYNSEFLYGELKNTFKQVYDTYTTKYNTLVNLSTTIANKEDLVTDSERLSIKNATNELLTALDNFLKQSEIVISNITSNEMNYIKNNLSKDFTDINNIINDLNNQMNESFKDGIITEIELKNLEVILSQLDKEKADIDKTYDEIYNNSNLN